MKRIFIGLLVLIMLVGTTFLGWWFLNPGYLSPSGYLPAGTLVYAELPNGTKSYFRYQQSKLKALVENPEYQALFGALALQLQNSIKDTDLTALDHLKKAGNEFLFSLGGDSFFAVTRLEFVPSKDLKTADAIKGIGAIAGFRNSPDGGNHVASCLQELLSLGKDGSKPYSEGSAVHDDLPYTYMDFNESGIRLCRMHWKEWDLFSFSEAPLLDFIDRISGKTNTESLKNSSDYRGVVDRLEKNPDLLVYYDGAKLLNLGVSWMSTLIPNAGLKTIYEKMNFLHGSASTISFSNGDIVEHTTMSAPETEREKSGMGYRFAEVPLQSVHYTTPSTVLYCVGNFDGESFYDQQLETFKAMQSAPLGDGQPAPQVNPYAMAEQQLKSMGLDLHENLLKAVGPEVAIILDWPQNQEIPDLLVLMGVKDKEKFSALYDKLTMMMTPMLAMVGMSGTLNVADFTGISVTAKQMPKVSPTLFKGSTFWGLSLTNSGAQRLLAGGNPLELNTIKGGANPPGKTYSLAYVKTGEILRRGYSLGKPYLSKYLTNNFPSKNWSGQLPDQLTCAPLVGEFHFVANSDGDYLTSESISPAGTLGLGIGIAAGVAVPVLAKSHQTSAIPLPTTVPDATTNPTAPAPAPVPSADSPSVSSPQPPAAMPPTEPPATPPAQ